VKRDFLRPGVQFLLELCLRERNLLSGQDIAGAISAAWVLQGKALKIPVVLRSLGIRIQLANSRTEHLMCPEAAVIGLL
jgi:hypothetical protein